ncbi:VCBS domain-containing protein [Psychrobacter sp. H7-1]|uniref:VCBS domain-containing protein n=1 Tax=Psychrobacter sp. H7-1 TaxID=1569265 RepID=UPI001918C511|nr:VCBS domain-containing protein [Psychrobacter sp. H7-1]
MIALMSQTKLLDSSNSLSDIVGAVHTADTTYGSIVLNADGTYTYTLDNDNSEVNALNDGETLTDTVEYTITDGDGDTTTATLEITINGHTDGAPVIEIPVDPEVPETPENEGAPEGAGDKIVYEGDDATPGSFTVTAEAGVDTITVGGQEIQDATDANPVTITRPEGTLVITGYDATTGDVSYTYDPNVQDHTGSAPNVDSYEVVVTDKNGVQSTDSLDIAITDSLPQATDDANSVTEDAADNTVSGNVTDNDNFGLDGEGTPAVTPITADTTYGSIVLNADGTYTYTLDNDNSEVNALNDGETLTDTVEYTITDGDGDTTTATLTITINGRTEGNPGVNVPDEGPKDPSPVDPTDPNSPLNEGNPEGLGHKTVYEGDGPVPGEFTVTVDTIDPNTKITNINVGGTDIAVDSDGNIVETTIDTGKGALVIKSYNPETGKVEYTYDPEVQNHETDAPVLDEIAIIVTDSNSNEGRGSLDIAITDSAPVAVADTRTVTEDDTNITGNVMGNDTINVDRPVNVVAVAAGATIDESLTTGVATVISGVYGDLTIDSNGNYTYTTNAAAQALNEGDSVTDVFSYVIKDSDGDTSATTVTMTVTGTNDIPVINTIVPVRVSEEGLVGGIKDNIGTSDTTNAVTASGTISFSDVDNTNLGNFSVTLNGPAGIKVQGNEVIWTWNAGTNTLTGTVTLDGSSVKVMTIEVGSIKSTGTGFSADYKTTLLHAIDHAPNDSNAPVTSIEDELAIDFGVVVNDGSDDSQSAVLSVIVEDDSPTLGLGSISIPVEPVNSNVMITLDISGSMNYSSGVSKPGGGEYTRLEVAKQAINKLLEGYDELGDVRVQLVTFSTYANGNPGNIANRWMTVSEAKTIVSGLVASGGTNYDAALDSATQAFGETGKLENATNYSYFLTDGNPTYGLTSLGNLTDNKGTRSNPWYDAINNDTTLGGTQLTGPGNSSNFNDAGIGTGEEAAWIAFLESKDIKSYAFSMGTGVSDTTNLKPIAYDGTPDGGGNTNDAELAKAITNLNQLDDILLGTLPASVSKNLIRGDLSPVHAGYGADGGIIYEITIDNKTYRYNEASNKVFVDNVAVAYNVYNPATFDLTIKTAEGGVLVLDVLSGEYTYQAAASKFYQESIEFTVKDNDGDYVSSNQILDIYPKGDGVNLTGTADSDILIGRAAAPDVLNGGAGDDIIRGKSGNDILTGGDGNDTFVWLAADKGGLGTPDLDIITDLSPGDKIQLSDLLQGETLDDVVSMAKYVNLEGNVLHVSSNGGYTGGTYTAAQTDLNIQLNGFTGTVDDLINNYII